VQKVLFLIQRVYFVKQLLGLEMLKLRKKGSYSA